jgi:hypothetical protein
MLCNDGYKYFYSYGFGLSYLLPIIEAPVVYLTKFNYEDQRGIYVYNTGESSIMDANLDEVIIEYNTNNHFTVQCIKKYDELENENDINFVEDGKEIFKEAVSEIVASFQIQVEGLEKSLEVASSDDDKGFISGNIDCTKRIISNIKKLENFNPIVKSDI